MIKTITDTEIAKTLKVGMNTLFRWKKDTEKYPFRYELYKLGALLKKNDISFFDVLSLAEKNIELEEKLKGLGK